MQHSYSLKSQPPQYLLIIHNNRVKATQVKNTPGVREFFCLMGAKPKNGNSGGNGNGHGKNLMPLREGKQEAKQAQPPAILPLKLKNSISEFLMDDGWADEPLSASELKEEIRELGIDRRMRSLGKRELEALWMDLRLEENRAHSEWMRKFHLLNPGITLVFVEREVEHPVFAEFPQLMDYISRSRDLPSKVAQKNLQELQIGAQMTINGRKDMEYTITRVNEGWHCAKKDCHLELTGETLNPENLEASKASIAWLVGRIGRLDALFGMVRMRLAKKDPQCDLPDRNSGTILANMCLAQALVNQSLYLRAGMQ